VLLNNKNVYSSFNPTCTRIKIVIKFKIILNFGPIFDDVTK